MTTGIVKWFNNRLCYGFIQPDVGGQDVFVHQAHILADGYRTLHEGERVRFIAVDLGRGPQAQRVQVITNIAVPELPPLGPGEAVAAVRRVAGI